MSSSNCCFLACIQISQEAGQRVWYSHLFQYFPQFIVIHIVKGFGIVNKAEIDENNRMGKTRDLSKKIRNMKGTFQAKMGTIKNRNGMDLTEAEDIKKRWWEYTEELYKKDLHDPDNNDGVWLLT